MGNMTVTLPCSRLYFSYSDLCYQTTTSTTVILQKKIWVYISVSADDTYDVDKCNHRTQHCAWDVLVWMIEMAVFGTTQQLAKKQSWRNT